MASIIKLKLVILLMFLLSGCWDYKEIHQITYVTAIGIDYKDKVFTVYLLALNFANIAQREGVRPPKHNSLVGTGKGATVTEAMFDLYNSEQQRVYWGHVSTMIIGEAALKEITVEQLTDTINRYREIRYNIWIYGTDVPINKLLDIQPNFGYSPYDSKLMKPDKTYSQFSTIKPMYLYRFLSEYYERGVTAMLPKLVYEKSHWTENSKPTPHLVIDGAYFYSYKKFRGEVSFSQMNGKRYLDIEAERMLITIKQNGQATATFVLNRPEIITRHTIQDGQVYYDIEILLTGYLDELIKEMSQATMNSLLQKKVEQEVRKTFEAGKKIKADILNLNTPVFRFDFSDWNEFIWPNPDMDNIHIRNIDVKVLIKYTGKYKGRID
ncbi:Ger(x)C family spore germination protein [Paenibacillus radicis (ex Xue et al. 2023)]|uniref:Ger(X)C family spore germination protein n=1 Tax=Paenibacillus radicis (ex Xue et al. 2023) TaxID=2972489 RepID=A0ABT1YCH5_9BACL|nr:Ger(x)C family spore germination protein [Paenibacillus radicis (ex Xue et al. 2023)]MCR8630892.1 Ger(x)C family spore germination protein [Paenibacillus radicis (ex Xue et al. 2023)]